VKLLSGKIMNIKNILLSCVLLFGSLSLSGCYTQLSMFHPEPEIENDDSEQFYETYSRAVPRPNLTIYARDGAGQSLGMAYQLMYNRFNGFMGFGNRYNYYNPYGYGGYYNETYTLGGYRMYIPYSDMYASGEKKIRTWTTDRGNSTSGTNLNVTRTRTNTNESTNNGDYSNSSSITRSTSSGTSTNSSSNGGGRRVTKRH